MIENPVRLKKKLLIINLHCTRLSGLSQGQPAVELFGDHSCESPPSYALIRVGMCFPPCRFDWVVQLDQWSWRLMRVLLKVRHFDSVASSVSASLDPRRKCSCDNITLTGRDCVRVEVGVNSYPSCVG